MTDSTTLTVVPADQATWEDLRTVFGDRGTPHDCACQWFKLQAREYRAAPVDERTAMLREQPGNEIAWGDLFVGPAGVYEACGFTEVSAPTPRRRMRIDFWPLRKPGRERKATRT